MLAFIVMVGAIIVGFCYFISLSLKDEIDMKTMAFLYKIGVVLSVLAAIGFTIYIGYRVSVSERKLLPFSVVFLSVGVIVESFRRSKDWKIIAKNFFISYLGSFFCFLPGKKERVYDFEKYIMQWPYAFLLVYSLLFFIRYKEKITAKLTEGITLLLSISMLYWCLDVGLFSDFDNKFLVFLAVFVVFSSLASIFYILTDIELTKNHRLILSIWSAIIILVFSIDNIYNVYNKGDLESSKLFSENFILVVQHFLLGISSMYFVQNAALIFRFLPSKGGNYSEDLAKIKKEHIYRYSDQQVDSYLAFLCLVYSLVLYGLNMKYHIFPRNVMIWFVIFTFPMILRLSKVKILK